MFNDNQFLCLEIAKRHKIVSLSRVFTNFFFLFKIHAINKDRIEHCMWHRMFNTLYMFPFFCNFCMPSHLIARILNNILAFTYFFSINEKIRPTTDHVLPDAQILWMLYNIPVFKRLNIKKIMVWFWSGVLLMFVVTSFIHPNLDLPPCII